VHATADAVGRFIDTARETGVLQGESCIESRNSCAYDSDPRHVLLLSCSLAMYEKDVRRFFCQRHSTQQLLHEM
jgi:hypothetical protein